MKNYIVYVNGIEKGIIKAKGHNEAEKKAEKIYGDAKKFPDSKKNISVQYTEI